MVSLTPKTSSENECFGLGSCPSGRAEGIERREPEDLERLYRTYSKRVYSLCLRMTGDVVEAEDLTQEAFVHLYRKLDTFRGESAFYTWFYRLVVNLILMRLRKRKRTQEMLLQDIANSDQDDGRSYPLEIGSADSALLGAVDHVDLQRAIDALPMGFKLVFVLHDMEGYEHEEISTLTGISAGTSKSQLHKARLRLRTLLREGLRAKAPRRRGRPRFHLALPGTFQAEPIPAS
jgi:RNA polymerase sigma-70 factor (ECF subfamily)